MADSAGTLLYVAQDRPDRLSSRSSPNFFPADTTTSAGFVAWIPVVVSIVVTTAVMLELALGILVPRLAPRVRRAIVAAYAAGFLAVVLLVDESFGSIVRFYMPALILLLIAAGRQALRGRSAGWTLIASGLTASIGAALLQQAEVSLHPVYFDHYAVYHVVQGIALVVLYLGFRRVPSDCYPTPGRCSGKSGTLLVPALAERQAERYIPRSRLLTIA